MKFDFFKKKSGSGGKKGKDLFDPSQDALDFDELEESGEFLSDENFDPTPPPAYEPPASSPQPPPPPTPTPAPPRQAPLPPAPSPGVSKLPPAAPATPAGRPPQAPSPGPQAPPVFDDLTVVNRPFTPPPPPGAGPVEPPLPIPPAGPAPVPPATAAPPPPVAPPTPPRTPPPRAGDDDVTMILSAPIGEERVVAWLVVSSEPGRGRDFRLPGGMARIGIDSGCEICLDFDSYISSRHAEISFRSGQYHLRDLSSTNGTFVNEVRTGEAVLNDNDRVRLGQTTLIFKSLTL